MRTGIVRAGAAALALAAAAPAAVGNELNASIWRADTHPFVTHGYHALAATVSRRSGGKLTIAVNRKPPIAAQAYLKALRDGVVDIAHHAATFTQDELPELALLAGISPGLKDPLASALAITELAIVDASMQARFRTVGVVFGGGYALPSQMLACRRPVTTLADLRGLKMRFANPVRRQWASSVGAAAVALPLGEATTAVKQGLVDCIAGDAATLKERGLLSVGMTLVAIDLGLELSGWQYAINRAAWRKLAAPMRRLLLDSMAEQVPVAVMANVAAARDAAREVVAAGMPRLQVEPAMTASYSAFVADAGRARAVAIAQGRLATADVGRLIDRFLALHARWTGLLGTIDREDAVAVGALLRREVYDRLDPDAYGMN